MRQIELLSPAGDLNILKAVICAGADAVYIGGPAFGARAYAGNFSQEELSEALDYAHIHGRKVYLTVNTLLKNQELTEQLYDYLFPCYEQGLDAVIVQDFGVLSFIREAFPGLAIHASTQMTVTGAKGAAFLQRQGAARIVTARELSFVQIRQIREETDVEIESFVHGALCYCYSGQCLFSSMLGGRSGNRGRCAQPCRLPYEVFDEQGRSLNKKAEYLLSPKDLCTISMIPQLAECGIDSFKIEGRMKQEAYAAGVTAQYRKYLDRFRQYGAEEFCVEESDKKHLFDLGNRSGFTDGYYVRHNGPEMITFSKPGHTRSDRRSEEKSGGCHIELQEKIKGKLKLFSGKHARLTVSCQESEITVLGDIPQPAQKAALEREDVLSRMKKTGNTPFIFETLELEMEEGIFLPVGRLNALRREALKQLEETMLGRMRRDGRTAEKPCMETGGQRIPRSAREICVSLEREELLELVCHKSYVDRICLEADSLIEDLDTSRLEACIGKIRSCQKEVFLAMPPVFREQTGKRYEKLFDRLCRMEIDGYLIRNYEELEFLQKRGDFFIQLDHNLYTYSDWTRKTFFDCGVSRDTIPLELNGKELRARNCRESELVLYGYLPLMVTAGCLHKSLGHCEKREELLFLKDRYGKYFPVKNNCKNCYNIIYNSAPLALFGMCRELEELEAASYRLQFTIEEREEVEKILSIFEDVFQNNREWDKNCLKDYTNGHMKRGVE